MTGIKIKKADENLPNDAEPDTPRVCGVNPSESQITKLAVGYQEPRNGEAFADIVRDYADNITEVYFSYPGMPSGRLEAENNVSFMLENLREIRAHAIKLDLLLNANCYGKHAADGQLCGQIAELIEYLYRNEVGPEIVTVCSPFLAATLKRDFPNIEIRASVNMRLDSTLAMQYVADRFDSFYIRRDLQRDINEVKLFHKWCVEHDKKLGILVNSGCLRYCPAQTFHDNLVAHNGSSQTPDLCWQLLGKPEGIIEFLRGSWVRPENVRNYAGYVDVIKLATRQHSNPRMVIGAYVSGSYDGNLLNLTEPCFAGLFPEHRIDNKSFPSDWFGTAGTCVRNCNDCGKCQAVLKQVFKRNIS